MQNPVTVGVKKPTGEVGFLHPEPELVALTREELSLSNSFIIFDTLLNAKATGTKKPDW
uniref:hypothetical protein n=1 Tax=Salmonella enterica TaxID=28901 RepID=UPI00144723D9|nr:hypothetical protein [Salmonella enterica]